MTDQPQLSRSEARELAREKARRIRDENRKKERRNKALLWSGVIVLVLAVLTAVTLVIINSMRPPATGPLNMLSDGIKVTEGFEAARTPGLQPGATPVASPPNESSDVLDIKIWVDYLCPYCMLFEEANRDHLDTLLADGLATVEVHPIAFLDRHTAGTKASTRSANAAACVANSAPDQFWDFHGLLMESQTAHGEPGLTDDRLVELTREADVKRASTIESCIRGQQFKNWVSSATDRALNLPIPGTDFEKVPGTPFVLVNGRQYQYTLTEAGTFDEAEFQRFLIEIIGTQFNSEPTPTPTPDPGSDD